MAGPVAFAGGYFSQKKPGREARFKLAPWGLTELLVEPMPQ